MSQGIVTYHACRGNPLPQQKPRHPAFTGKKYVPGEPITDPAAIGELKRVRHYSGNLHRCRELSWNDIGHSAVRWCDYYGQRLGPDGKRYLRCDECMREKGK